MNQNIDSMIYTHITYWYTNVDFLALKLWNKFGANKHIVLLSTIPIILCDGNEEHVTIILLKWKRIWRQKSNFLFLYWLNYFSPLVFFFLSANRMTSWFHFFPPNNKHCWVTWDFFFLMFGVKLWISIPSLPSRNLHV